MSDANQAGESGKPPKGFKGKLKRWGIRGGLALVLLFLLFRYLPSASYSGHVQRVYEKATEYRMEFVTDDGEVRVFTNKEQRLPYMKFNTADVQANMEKYQREGDHIRITTWGIRSAMFSSFPNVVDVEHLRAGTSVRQARTERILEAVIQELRAQQLVLPGKEAQVREILRPVIERANALPKKAGGG